MPYRAAVVLAFFFLFSLQVAAQGFANRQTFTGLVVNSDGSPVADARVEVRDLRNGQTVASGFSGPTGTFEIHNVPPGDLEVVASAGLMEARERAGFVLDNNFVLRMPATTEPPVVMSGDQTVSVRQLQVPRRAAGELNRAQRALDKGDLERAHQHVERALERHPHFPEALTLRAVLKVQADETASAIEDLEKALFIDSSYQMAYLVLAATFNATGEYDKAVRSADRAIALAPTGWQGPFEMGKALLALGDFEAALRQFQRAEDLNTERYPPLHLAKAHALLGMEHYDAATTELQVYLAGSPEGPGAIEAQRTLDQVNAFRTRSRR